MSLINLKLGLGAHPSPTDHRDHRDTQLAMGSPMPDKYVVDISKLQVRMQYFIGKCIGEGNAKKADDLFGMVSSDDFIYLGAKSIDGNLTEGSNIRSALKFMQQTGVCRYSTFSIPVNDTTTYAEYITNKAPQAAFDEAASYKIGEYFSVTIDIDMIKAALLKYGALVARVDVGEEWYTDVDGVTTWDATKILPLRAPQTVISGHCIVIYGYDSTLTAGKTALHIANSWSTDWADNGNGYLYFEDYMPHISEAWVVTLDKQIPSPVVSDATVSLFVKFMQYLGLMK